MQGSISMTPLMRQYYSIKNRFPQEIVLFQVGDFYEIFDEDAKKVSASLGIVLTQRGVTDDNQPIPLCGFPRHTADTYLLKLISAGFRVVMCDQVPSAEPSKLIERTVSQVLTPGTLVDAKLLDEKSAIYLAVISLIDAAYGVLFIEILTGRIVATVVSAEQKALLESELGRFLPQEVLVPQYAQVASLEPFIRSLGYITTEVPFTNERYGDWIGRVAGASASLIMQTRALVASINIMHGYLQKNNPQALANIQQVDVYKPEDFLILDAATQRNLELVKNNQDGTRAHTLLAVLDGAVTAMGSRIIKKWILRPLADKIALKARQSYVHYFFKHAGVREHCAQLLRKIGDFERVVGRIALQRASHEDYLRLMKAMTLLPELYGGIGKEDLQDFLTLGICRHTYAFQAKAEMLNSLLSVSLNDDENFEGKIKAGYHTELDRLRSLIQHESQAIAMLEQKEQQLSGISSLKIRFNSIHGYGIEITKTHVHLAPDRYTRLQTLVNRERFTTQELKDLEYSINRAQTTIAEIEREIFVTISQKVFEHVSSLKLIAQELAELDGYLGLAQSAYDNNFICPIMIDGRDFVVKQGRHPMVEQRMRACRQGQFIGNDVTLTEQERLWIITGPNMGGKSTFLRQSALIAIMAHMGSFVPAQSAHIPLFDRIFTRIGAADNVAQGKSTFWVEMEETALICDKATERSLVILDEVGRGTSTYDGLAIAQAVVEYIYAHIKARCLFATHYHELTDLVENHNGIVAYHAASKKTGDNIVLLHSIRQGCAQGSFGIEVAKGAHLPSVIVARAQAILATFMQQSISMKQGDHQVVAAMQQEQDTIIAATPTLHDAERKQYDVLRTMLQELDLDSLSPRQAYDLVGKLKDLV